MSDFINPTVADDPEEGDVFTHAGVSTDAASDTQDHAELSRDTQEHAEVAKRSRGRPRLSRAQTERDNVSVHSEHSDPAYRPLNFASQELPPLPGNVQMYVRMSVQGQPDWDNVRDFLARGWRPRTRDTIPEGYFSGTRKINIDDVDYGNVVCKRDRILMERPKWVHDQEKELEKRQQRDMDQLIRSTLEQGQRDGLVVGAKAQYGTVTAGTQDFNFS